MSKYLMILAALLFTLSGCGRKTTVKSCSCDQAACQENCACDCGAGSATAKPQEGGSGEGSKGGGCAGGSCGKPASFAAAAVLAACSACVTTGEVSPKAVQPIEFALDVIHEVGQPDSVWKSEDYAGQPIIVEFYFNSCPSCNENAPNVDTIKGKVEGIAQVVEVSIDCQSNAWLDWLRRHHPKSPVVNDCGGVLTDHYDIQRFPTVLFLDGTEHRAVYQYAGVWTAAVQRKILQLAGAD